MQEVWKLLGIQAKHHTSHHPISSGQVERANRTVVSMLKKYVSANQKDWDIKLPLVLMAAQATPHQSTGEPPFALMTGRRMTLPLYLLYQQSLPPIPLPYLEELHQHREQLSPSCNSKEAQKVVRPTTTKRPLTMSLSNQNQTRAQRASP